METIIKINDFVNGIVWGVPIMLLILGTGVYYTVRLGFIQFRHPVWLVKQTIVKAFQKKDEGPTAPGELTSFQAAMTSVSAIVGSGNIAGAATAIVMGGPGALIWMILAAFVGMATKFAEIALGIKYRKVHEDGTVSGGAMYYLSEGLHQKWLGILFSILVIPFAFVISGVVDGSKYVQSDLKDTFKKIRQELITSDKTVLFVGTPCQVEGLLYYLGKKEKEHLLTVDLVCYGVPSPGLYKEWIQDIAQKHGSKVSRVYFRDKKYGYAGVNVKVMLQNGQALEDIVDVKTYTKTMFSKLGLRPSCYKCVYRGRNKMSDFTIGDFWQIGDYSKQMDDDRGTSIVQINTRKGEDFLNDIGSEKIKKIHVETLENDDLKSKIYKEDYTFEIPKNRSQFFEDSGRMSYDDLIQKYLPASRKDKMATALKPIIHKMPFSHFFFRTMKKVRMNRRKRK